MISNARGKHSSPGVYIEEIDKSYSNKSIGITTLGVAGETLKGPAFEPVRISDWNEFQEYFGGTSTDKFKGTGYPKYELPYIAKSFLQESKQLEVCRVLGFSGYNAGPSWVIYGTKDSGETKYIIAVLRSKASYSESNEGDVCNPSSEFDKIEFTVTGVTMSNYTTIESSFQNCTNTNTSSEKGLTVGKDELGKFKLIISTKNGEEEVAVSLNPSSKNYIVDVLGFDAQEGDYSIFVEELYDLAHIKACHEELYNEINISGITDKSSDLYSIMSNYQEAYRYACTPWFVSELKGEGLNLEMKKLFRFYTISDGNSANSQIKISIENILPDEGYFDVVIRDYNDTDGAPIVLERFAKCNMVPGSPNYVGLKIGTFNGEYMNKSKYVTIEVIENDMTEACVPCGFLGYPMRNLSGYNVLDLDYNTEVFDTLKVNRQYFGMSDIVGVDLDVLSYKGKNAYNESQHPNYGYSKGFHLDAFINAKVDSPITCTVDGVSGYTFTTPSETVGMEFGAVSMPHIASEEVMAKNIYADKKMRKFTCYPYGGFDGWDIYRKQRTNTNKYRANKYKGILNVLEGSGDDKKLSSNNAFTTLFDAASHGLSGKVINSDYYAYLAAYKQFDNPNKININILATPGIDYVNNLDLFNEVLDIVEESRQGDCIYIVTTPDTDVYGNFIDAESAVNILESQDINTSYAATYYPWVKYYDSSNKKYINLPVTKDVVRNFAYTDNVSHPWFASAGMSRGNVDCEKACHFTKNEEEDVLYEGMINPVKSFGVDGVKIWGNKTMYQEDTPLNRINVRRLMIRVKDLVMSSSRQLIFEQNDNTVEKQFRSIVEPILSNAKQNRGISDYKIKTDTSAEARDRKELPARIWVKPINCLEYIPISFVITPEGANFED